MTDVAPELTDSGKLKPEHHAVVDAIVDRMQKRDTEQSGAAKAAARMRTWKEIVAAAVFFIGLFYGGALVFKEFQDKPTMKAVDDRIDSKVAPLAKDVEAVKGKVEEVEKSTDSIKRDVRRVKQVQDLQLDQAAWQGDVLDHLANKRRGPAPRKPDRVREKERELIR